MAEQRYRVYNECKYDIGVRLVNGQEIVIRHNSFQMLTADDINYIESVCTEIKFFAKKMLVPKDEHGEVLDFQKLGMFVEEDPFPHLTDDEIAQKFKQPIKKIEEWLAGVEDPAELHGIAEVAKTLDLPASKLKVLNAKMPERDLVNE